VTHENVKIGEKNSTKSDITTAVSPAMDIAKVTTAKKIKKDRRELVALDRVGTKKIMRSATRGLS
jgi:hypothetical protein